MNIDMISIGFPKANRINLSIPIYYDKKNVCNINYVFYKEEFIYEDGNDWIYFDYIYNAQNIFFENKIKEEKFSSIVQRIAFSIYENFNGTCHNKNEYSVCPLHRCDFIDKVVKLEQLFVKKQLILDFFNEKRIPMGNIIE